MWYIEECINGMYQNVVWDRPYLKEIVIFFRKWQGFHVGKRELWTARKDEPDQSERK